MKLYIEWRYPDETERHNHTFYDIDPVTISMAFGFLTFGTKNYEKHWNFPVSHILEMKVSDEE